jgi:uncharacterized protein YraI
MLRRRLATLSFGLVLLAALGIASAQDAYTAKPMNVRAGPDRDYPLVAQLDAGTPLVVNGCLDGWSWCDVSFEGNRGWMYGGGIYFEDNGNDVWLYSYGPQVNLPIITFSLDAYWGQYYRGRPWYAQRQTWAHRHFAPPPRLARPAGRPPQRGSHPMMSHSRAPAPPRSGGAMRGHAAPQEHAAPQGHTAPEGRGPPKGGHTQRPAPSSHGNEHGSSNDRQHSEDQPHNPP